MHRLHLAGLFAALVDPTLIAQSQPVESDPSVVEATAKLAAIGYAVPKQVAIVDRTTREVLADLDAQQDLLFPRDAFTLQHALFQALGVRTFKDGPALRRQAVAGMARGMSAYYDPIGKSFVLLDTAARSASEAMTGSLLPLVLHELVHACQDARPGGLTAGFDPATSTFDEALVMRMVMEGEAEVAAAAAMSGPEAAGRLVGRGSTALERLFGGELTGLLYANGRELVAARFLADGWPGVQDLWSRRPASSEQVMHATKRGSDEPCAVTLPTFDDAEQMAATTLGELMTYHLLRQQGADTQTAGLAAAGWDGDRVVVLRAKDGRTTAVVWRSVWDRPEDAEQFAATQKANERVDVRVAGRGVDLVGTKDAEWRGLLAAACAAAPGEWPATAGDAASTAELEVALRRAGEANAVRDNRWELREHGLSIPVPEDFQLREMNGVRMLIHGASQQEGFAVNVNVQVAQRGEYKDIQTLVESARKEIAQIPTLTLDRLEAGTLGEHEVAFGEFHGRIGSMAPIHCLQLYYLTGEHRIIVTATSGLGQWSEYEAMLRALMADVRISAK